MRRWIEYRGLPDLGERLKLSGHFRLDRDDPLCKSHFQWGRVVRFVLQDVAFSCDI